MEKEQQCYWKQFRQRKIRLQAVYKLWYCHNARLPNDYRVCSRITCIALGKSAGYFVKWKSRFQARGGSPRRPPPGGPAPPPGVWASPRVRAGAESEREREPPALDHRPRLQERPPAYHPEAGQGDFACGPHGYGALPRPRHRVTPPPPQGLQHPQWKRQPAPCRFHRCRWRLPCLQGRGSGGLLHLPGHLPGRRLVPL